MDTTIADHLPMQALDIMGSFFEKGNIVNSFKRVGNAYGFSLTFQLSAPKSSSPELSPLTTPNSKRCHKSPAAIARDRHRIDSYVISQNDTSINETRLIDTHTELPVRSETQNNENDDEHGYRNEP